MKKIIMSYGPTNMIFVTIIVTCVFPSNGMHSQRSLGSRSQSSIERLKKESERSLSGSDISVSMKSNSAIQVDIIEASDYVSFTKQCFEHFRFEMAKDKEGKDISLLGQGQSAQVFLVTPNDDNKDYPPGKYVIKLVMNRHVHEENYSRWIKTEKTVLDKLKEVNSSYFPKVFHTQDINWRKGKETVRHGAIFIMEYNAGKTLKEFVFDTYNDETKDLKETWFKENPNLELKTQCKPKLDASLVQTKSIFQQIVKALEVLHKLKIAHMDLKPENIFISEVDGDVKVMLFDFGNAWVEGDDIIAGQCVGTLQYTAPEVSANWLDLEEEASDSDDLEIIPYKCDLWALGIIFFKCATGEYAFMPELEKRTESTALNHSAINRIYKEVLELQHKRIEAYLKKCDCGDNEDMMYVDDDNKETKVTVKALFNCDRSSYDGYKNRRPYEFDYMVFSMLLKSDDRLEIKDILKEDYWN